MLGVDARDGLVAIKGWEETIHEDAVEFTKKMQKLGASRVIYTDISRDGMLEGANIPAIKRMAESLDIPVIASGGVSSVSDILALKALESLGVEGLYWAKLSTRERWRWVTRSKRQRSSHAPCLNSKGTINASNTGHRPAG